MRDAEPEIELGVPSIEKGNNMSGQIENLYKVQKKDIPKAGVVLADAFQHDPVWKLVFRDEASLEQRGVLFESPIKFWMLSLDSRDEQRQI